jgi:hypothetical protein
MPRSQQVMRAGSPSGNVAARAPYGLQIHSKILQNILGSWVVGLSLVSVFFCLPGWLDWSLVGEAHLVAGLDAVNQ